jgi:transcriptional regulator with XRE-family HTH domain
MLPYYIIYKSESDLCFDFEIILATFVKLMYTIMNNRLKQFLSAENITQAQFADNLNVVRASVSHILSGRNNPGYDFIKALMSNYPRLNIEWLIFGKGKMYKDMETLREQTSEEGQLFPVFEPDTDIRIAETVAEDIISYPEPATNEMNDLNNPLQVVSKQRKVSKIIVLFDDGTFQEM